MLTYYDGGTIDFKIRIQSALVSRKKAGTLMLLLLSIVPLTLLVFALNYVISTCASEEISSLLTTSSDGLCDRKLPEFVACGNTERSDSNEALYGRLLVSKRPSGLPAPVGFILSIYR